MKKLIQVLVLSLSVVIFNAGAAEPTVKEIYQTAQTDRAQALRMINEVIKNRPNSARAYYIQSELLLQMNKKSEAKAAFLRSQSIDPALSFAKPESVARLENALGIKKPLVSQADTNRYILYGVGLLLVIIIAVMLLRRKKPTHPNYMESYNLQNRPITPYTDRNQVAAQQSQPTSSTQPSMPQSAPAPQSGGSGLMGSLAQGAAMGVGVAAGATLANHLLNGNKATAAPAESAIPSAPSAPAYTPDSNFGISDTSSDWGGGSSGDSWSDGSSDSGDSSDW